MSPLRKKRLESSLQREMANLIMHQQTKDERIEFVSVHNVDLASDMNSVKIYLSFFGHSEEDKIQAYRALCEKRKDFQSSLGRNLKLRFTPRLMLLQLPPESVDG